MEQQSPSSLVNEIIINFFKAMETTIDKRVEEKLAALRNKVSENGSVCTIQSSLQRHGVDG